jgi:hypothetical protein
MPGHVALKLLYAALTGNVDSPRVGIPFGTADFHPMHHVSITIAFEVQLHRAGAPEVTAALIEREVRQDNVIFLGPAACRQ